VKSTQKLPGSPKRVIRPERSRQWVVSNLALDKREHLVPIVVDAEEARRLRVPDVLKVTQ